jgi:predicted MFS family arabinose efflux permease
MAVFFNFLGSLALGPFVPIVADDLRTTVALVGQVPAATMLVAALLGLAAGPIADRLGYRVVLLAGLLAVVGSTLGSGLAPTYGVLLSVSLVGAIGRAAITPVSQAIVSDRFSNDDTARRRAISLISAGAAGAAIIGVPLLTGLAGFVQWRGALLALAVLGLIVSLALWRVVESVEHRHRVRVSVPEVIRAYTPLLRHTPSLSIIASTVLGNASGWAVWTYAAAYFVQRYDFSAQQIG